MRVAAEEYLRRFWWVILGVPVSGLLMLLLIDHPVVKYLGFVGVCWPLTIPARAVLITNKKARRLARPTWVSVEDDAIYFHDESGGGTKIPFSIVSGLRNSGDLYVIQTRNFSFTVMPSESLASEEDRAEFESALAHRAALPTTGGPR